MISSILGDVVVQLDSRLEELEVERRRLVMENAKSQWEGTKTVFDKSVSVSHEELLKKQADYDVAHVDYQIALEQLHRRSLFPPHPGVIAEMRLHPGEACIGYQPVVRLVDTRKCYRQQRRSRAKRQPEKRSNRQVTDRRHGDECHRRTNCLYLACGGSGKRLAESPRDFDNADARVHPGQSGRWLPYCCVCMATPPPSTRTAVQKALSDLSALAQFAGPPREFWPRFLDILLELTRADQLVLLAQKPGSPWRRLLDRPADMAPCLMLSTFANRLAEIADAASRDATVLVRLELKQGSTAGHFAVAARLNLPQSQEQCIVAALLSEVSETVADEVLLRIRLAGQTPQAYLAEAAAAQARVDVEKFASTVDLFASLAGEKRFMAVAMSVCNGLASKFKCDRVSLGWLKGGFIHLHAISRIEKFDRQMTAAKSLESAMEEALDQDDEIIWPVPDGSTTVSRDHERFAREHEVGNLCSLPLRNGDDPLAVITCERQSPGFSLAEVQQLRLIADLVAPRLAELHRTDRWFGTRWATAFREQTAKLIGPEHTWAKLLALLIAIVLALLIFFQVPYRVEGTFILRSDQSSYLSAPYEGYIEHVFVRPGDAVTNNQPLLQLKTAELQLDEACIGRPESLLARCGKRAPPGSWRICASPRRWRTRHALTLN